MFNFKLPESSAPVLIPVLDVTNDGEVRLFLSETTDKDSFYSFYIKRNGDVYVGNPREYDIKIGKLVSKAGYGIIELDEKFTK